MKKLRVFIVMLFLILMTMGTCDAADKVYSYVTGQTAKVGWEHNEFGLMFEVKLRLADSGDEYVIGETAELYYVIPSPRAGLFEVAIRARDSAGNHSDWSWSLNPEVCKNGETFLIKWVLGVPGPVEISPPGPIEISKEEFYYGLICCKNIRIRPVYIS